MRRLPTERKKQHGYRLRSHASARLAALTHPGVTGRMRNVVAGLAAKGTQRMEKAHPTHAGSHEFLRKDRHGMRSVDVPACTEGNAVPARKTGASKASK